MTEQRVIVLSGLETTRDMQTQMDQAIADGWRVVSVTAQTVGGYNDRSAVRGGYLIVLERDPDTDPDWPWEAKPAL